jgi:hypothetical protein
MVQRESTRGHDFMEAFARINAGLYASGGSKRFTHEAPRALIAFFKGF